MQAPTAAANAAQAYDIVYVPLGAQAHGGAERSLMDLATRFARRGKRVLILVGPELASTDFIEEAERRGLPMQRVEWTHRRSRLHNLRAALHVWHRLHAALVHFNISWHPDMWLVALCARLATQSRLVGSMRAMPNPHQLVPRRRYLGFVPGLQLWHWPELAAGWLWGRILHRTVTVNANDFAARLIRHYAYPADRLAVVYNGIDASAPGADAAATQLLRHRAGIADSDFLVVLVGRLSSEKGADLLLRAIAPLDEHVKAVLVGDGPQRAQLEALTDELELRARVTFVGYTPRPETWMAAADVVTVPSTCYEAFGRVVIEAMNQGTPVIASRIGGMAELFEDGIEGKYVAAGDPAALHAAIASLAVDPASARRLGERGRRLVHERYSLERVEAEYAKVYEGLLDAVSARKSNHAAAEPAGKREP